MFVRSRLRAGRINHVGIAASIWLAASAAGTAEARPMLPAPCTDSWSAPVSGSWSDARKWSTGHVPGSSDDVCITQDGTYTVTVRSPSTPSVDSLQIGVSSGSAVLAVDCSTFQASSRTVIGPDGELELTAASGCGSETLGSIENAGAVRTESGSGGSGDTI